MVPLWVTIATSLGAGAFISSLLSPLLQYWLNNLTSGRKLKEEKKERIRQAGKIILQAAQHINDITTDATHFYELDMEHVPGAIRATHEGLFEEGYGPVQDRSKEYIRLGAELRSELSRFDEGIAAIRLEMPGSEIFADLSDDGVISSFRFDVRFSLRRIEKELASGERSEKLLLDMKHYRRMRLVSGLETLQKILPELVAEPDKAMERLSGGKRIEKGPAQE